MLTLFIAVLTFGAAYSQTSLAHVNTQRVLDTMPSRKHAMQELDKFEERAIQELQETQRKLQEDYGKLQQEQSTMSPTAYKFEEDRLMRKSQEFQQRQQELDQQIRILGDELNKPILDRVQKSVEKVCKLEKIDYVLDESTLLYSKGRDITDKVIVEVLKLEAEATAAANKE
ncbi:MAG TPA: OmpH family outer membrane protein [Brumimicrobium sp.]|nr:OmpH family outer membrane protein [Brumimicrobium sp.]